MYIKAIKFCGFFVAAGCDGKCNKAWGICLRPKVQLSNDVDDYEWKADSELGNAPRNPKSYEGEDTKPINGNKILNKWCVRECERSSMAGLNKLVILRDFSKRIKNIKSTK